LTRSGCRCLFRFEGSAVVKEVNRADEAIVLVGLAPALRRAFSEQATRLGLVVHDLESPTGADLPSLRPSLCVLEVGGSDSRVVEQVGSLSKLAAAVPLVVLARNLGAALGSRLCKLGAVAVIDLPERPEDVAAEALGYRTSEPPRDGVELLGETAAMRAARRFAERVAAMPAPVLISGETGTGKETLARLIHGLSDRASQPFAHFECAGATLAELEHAGDPGSGTLLLDGVGALDAPLQARVVRFQHSNRLAGRARMPRLIAATRTDLREATRRGEFRRDLYYRLGVLEIRLPPLRERRSDIPILVRAALERISRHLNLSPPQASEAFQQRLLQHDWPGNVRELHGVLERLLVGGPCSRLEAADLDGVLPRLDDSPPMRLQEVAPEKRQEAALLARVLTEVGGNVSRATRRLGMPRTTLRRRIGDYGLDHLILKD
jgi:DNA-binding NtrC family response regulator